MTSPSSAAHVLVLGEVAAILDAWRTARDDGDLSGPEAMQVLALWGALSRLQPGAPVEQARARVRPALDDPALWTNAVVWLGQDSWEATLRALRETLERELESQDEHRAFAEAARHLLRSLDDMALAVWAAIDLGRPFPPRVVELVETRTTRLLDALPYLLDAASLAALLLDGVASDLEHRQPTLWETTVALELVAALDPALLDPAVLEPQGQSNLASEAEARRLRQTFRRLPQPVAPRLAAAAPHAPGTTAVRSFLWRHLLEGWEVVLDVPEAPAEGEARLLALLLHGRDHCYTERFDGWALILCGLELPVQGHRAQVPLSTLRKAWDSWAPDHPAILLLGPACEEVELALVEPGRAP